MDTPLQDSINELEEKLEKMREFCKDNLTDGRPLAFWIEEAPRQRDLVRETNVLIATARNLLTIAEDHTKHHEQFIEAVTHPWHWDD